MRDDTNVDRLRVPTMDDSINPFEYRDVDCSGRSLATLLVAWVGAAMVASVLLRWQYMWIALTILTLLFLFACGYAAYNARKAHERMVRSEETRILEQRRRDRNIQSVSGAMHNCPEVSDPPAYEAYWITDLPPPYAVVISAEPPPIMPEMHNRNRTATEPLTPAGAPRRLSNPPPYSVAIQSGASAAQSSNLSYDVRTSSSDHQIVEEPTNSRRERVLVTQLTWDEDKVTTEQPSTAGHNSQNNSNQTVLATGTQYLSNIISSTFGRVQRRNPDRNNTMNRDIPDISLNTSDNRSAQQSMISGHRISFSTL